MSWTLQRSPQQMVRACTSRQLLTVVCILELATSILVGAAVTSRTNAAPSGSPTVAGNFLVDQDQNLQFPQNKQNEPAITRDPLTGMLIAGANDELEQPPWHNHPTRQSMSFRAWHLNFGLLPLNR